MNEQVSTYVSDVSKRESWQCEQEGPRGCRAMGEVSMKERDPGWATEAEWDLTK